MSTATVSLAIAAFLSGTVTTVFAMLIAGIHATDRYRPLTEAPGGQIDAFTRNLLGVGVRTDHLASPRDDEEN